MIDVTGLRHFDFELRITFITLPYRYYRIRLEASAGRDAKILKNPKKYLQERSVQTRLPTREVESTTSLAKIVILGPVMSQ